MRAVVLAGGLGMRLRPYTTILPKPLLPIGDRPILEIILGQLASAGFERVDLCVGHLGDLIRVYFSEGTVLPDGLELDWHWEPEEPLGTAGALRVVPGLDTTFLAMNGDILTTLDYGDLMAHHRETGAALTIAVQGRRVEIDLGVLELDGPRVTGYREKPTLTYDVSMGIYAYEPRALAHLPADGACQFPELVQRLLAAGEHVAYYRSEADWFDIGTTGEYERAVAELERRGGWTG
jgi:NDP-sugar pyrophosphorylase family protein